MELPPTLRQAVDRALEGVAAAELKRAADTLSQRYRAEVRDGRLHVADDLAARAYLAARLPATYAVVRAGFAALAQLRPDLAPRSLLDIGAGPGTVMWAAADCWPSLDRAVLVEASPVMRAWSERLGRPEQLRQPEWRAGPADTVLADVGQHDLVTISFVLDEVAPEARRRLIDIAWTRTADTLLVVEPGRPVGWERILRVRAQLIAAGAHIVAPCAHAAACPLSPPDWCHFSQRLPRSRMHRLAKGGDVPWEDEKYIYVAASRSSGTAVAGRVLAPPRSAPGQVRLKLCQQDGRSAERHFSRRDGAAFKAARRLDWGDALLED